MRLELKRDRLEISLGLKLVRVEATGIRLVHAPQGREEGRRVRLERWSLVTIEGKKGVWIVEDVFSIDGREVVRCFQKHPPRECTVFRSKVALA